MSEILIAADSEAVYHAVSSVLAGPGVNLRWVREGQFVGPELDRLPADLLVVDMQIGTMGGIAVTMDLRLDSDAGRIEPTKVLLLCDRRPDTFMAGRAGVDGWLIKPLNPIKLRRASAALLSGGTYFDDAFLPDPVEEPRATSVGASGK